MEGLGRVARTAGTAGLWALLWPVLLPWTLIIIAIGLPARLERVLAAPLGVAAGLAQGGVLAAASLSRLLLSRGGPHRLLYGG